MKKDDKKTQLIVVNKKEKELRKLNDRFIEVTKVINNTKIALAEKDLPAKDKKALEKELVEAKEQLAKIDKERKSARFKKVRKFFQFKAKYKELAYSPSRSTLPFRIFIITLAAFITTFALHFFIHPANLYTGGLRTVQQIIFYGTKGSIPEWSTYLIFFALNVPLAYFGFKYIGKWFTLLTLYYLIIQAGFDELFHLNYITQHLEGIRVIKLGAVATEPQIYISAVIGALFYGLGVSLTFIAGGSSGGTKFVVAWLQKKHNMSLGKSALYIAFVMITIGLFVNGMAIDHKNFFSVFFTTTTMATVIFMICHATMQNTFAPRTKQTVITIQTSNISKVVEVIDSTILSKRVWYTYKIKKNGDSKHSSVVVLTVDRRETNFIMDKLSKRLPSALITYVKASVKSDAYVVRGFD